MLGICRFKTVFKGPVKFWDLRGTGPGCPTGRAKMGTVHWCLGLGSISSANIMFWGDLSFVDFLPFSLKS